MQELFNRLLRRRILSKNGCWLADYAPASNGYVQLKTPHGAFSAHRISWEVQHGPIPAGLQVCHKCDVRNCFNPDHLFLGTALDNMADAREKGRLVGTRAFQAQPMTDEEIAIWIKGVRRRP